MNIILRTAVLLSLLIFGRGGLGAQNAALKTNLLYDAALSPNLGVEFRLAPKWTLDVSGQFNLWKLSEGKQWRHWAAMPEARYWFCNAFSGHFLALHVFGGQYNIGNVNLDFDFLGTDFSVLKDSRAQGWFTGAGIGYGYDWILSRHWSLEAEIGIGWAYTRYDRYPCAVCGRKLDDRRPHNYVGPTKAAVSIVYAF
ncbi:MAG: DUF3575 domain-containing protein [Muribaculaceae bacterium]|nr:DUF3575 domain-containing protein [Muribaculaceae bacterium]